MTNIPLLPVISYTPSQVPIQSLDRLSTHFSPFPASPEAVTSTESSTNGSLLLLSMSCWCYWDMSFSLLCMIWIWSAQICSPYSCAIKNHVLAKLHFNISNDRQKCDKSLLIHCYIAYKTNLSGSRQKRNMKMYRIYKHWQMYHYKSPQHAK